MQYTTSLALCALVRALPARIHVLAVLCFITLALLGICLEVSGGWLVWPPVTYALPALRPRQPAAHTPDAADVEGAWCYIRHTWPQPCLQGLLLYLLWMVHGHGDPAWGVLVPWLAWASPLAGLLWLTCRSGG
jgi:hypothetical protein